MSGHSEQADAIGSPASDGVRPIAPPFFTFTAAVGGMTAGFVIVTLGYVLAGRGFSVAAVAGLVSLYLLPSTWRLLVGPLFDLSLTPRHWFLLSAIASAIAVGSFAVVRLDPANLAVIGALVLAMGIFYAMAGTAQTASIAITSAPAVRGRIAGWVQTGNLGGTGVGGGLGLWLASHIGMTTAALTLAALCLVSAWPMLLIRTPRARAGHPFADVVKDLGDDIAALVRTRRGLLTAIAVTVPLGQGAFLNLLPSVARDWGASADLTASTTGLLAGLITIPGCLVGGYVCDRFPAQTVLAWSGVGCAVGEAAMALGPRTPDAFVVFALLGNLLLGFSYAAVAAVTFVGLRGLSGGTIGSLLGSLSNVPLVATTALLGAVAAPYGVSGMMWTEAVLGVVSAFAYLGLAWLWRPRATGSPLAA